MYVFVMEMNDSTQAPVMIFSEHLQTVGFTKVGSFFTCYQLFKSDRASWSYYITATKKFPRIEGVMTLSILNSAYCSIALPFCLSASRRCVSLGNNVITKIPCNTICNMHGRDYKESLYAGDGIEQTQGKNIEGQYM
jgi:hypothetical protein